MKWACGCTLDPTTGEAKICGEARDCDKLREEREESERDAEYRQDTIIKLATVTFAVSNAGPKPLSPRDAIRLATSFVEEVAKQFGEKATRRLL